MKLHKILIIVLWAILLVTLTGCDRSGKELEETKTALASVQSELAAMKEKAATTDTSLAEMIKERDSLKISLEKANESLSGITEERNQLKTQVESIAKAAKTTVAEANAVPASTTITDQLTAQLKEQAQKLATSEDKIKQLEALIETLKSQLKNVQGVSIPKL